MGMIEIRITGSFEPHVDQTFSAMECGHAAAVGDAIHFLCETILPAAIEQDHALHSDGATPEGGWGRPQEGKADGENL